MLTLTGHEGWIDAVTFSRDGKSVASASSDGTVRPWDPATGAPAQTLTGHEGRVYAVTFSRDGKLVASASDDGTVKLWDLAAGAPVQMLRINTEVLHLSFSSSDQYLDTNRGRLNIRPPWSGVIFSGTFVEENWVSREMKSFFGFM